MTTSLRVAAQRWGYSCLVLALLIAGCASTREDAVPAEKPGLGMEQLLRLPVENGHEGVDEVVHALQALYGVGPDTQLPPSNSFKTPVTLADGIVLAQTLTDTRLSMPKWSELAIEVTDKPCFPVERAAALIGAKKMDEHLGNV